MTRREWLVNTYPYLFIDIFLGKARNKLNCNMSFKYRTISSAKMKIPTRIKYLLAFLFVVCLVSLLSFPVVEEGYLGTYDDYYSQLDAAANNNSRTYGKDSKSSGSISGSTGSGSTGSGSAGSGSAGSCSAGSASLTPIHSNAGFLKAVAIALMSPPNHTADMNAIYSIEARISNLTTKNAKKMLSEMTSPNAASNPRRFLQYMNWYGSNCPIDSNICLNVV